MNDERKTERRQWLEDRGARERDVFVDEDGDEYIMEEVEHGTPGDGEYEISSVRKFLPHFND